MITQKTSKEIYEMVVEMSDRDFKKSSGVVWLCRDEVKSYLNCVFTDLKYLNEDDDYKKGYNHAVEDIFYQLERIKLCNSQEQKEVSKGTTSVPDSTSISPSVSCEHKVTGEDKNFLVSDVSKKESSPVQNPCISCKHKEGCDKTKEDCARFQYIDLRNPRKLREPTEKEMFDMFFPKKCTCKHPIIPENEPFICVRCGGKL